MSHYKNEKQTGFTIVEVTISMAFISVLIITLLLVGIQLAALYNKGITIRDVNVATRTLIRSMQDDVAASNSIIRIGYYDSSGATTVLAKAKNIQQATQYNIDYYEDEDLGGRLCTGTFTYVWNYRGPLTEYNIYKQWGRATGGRRHDKVQLLAKSPMDITPVRFVKIPDSDKVLCNTNRLSATGNSQGEVLSGKYIPPLFAKEAIPVLGESERNLVLYNFSISSPSQLKYGTGSQSEADLDVATRFYSSFYTFNVTVGSALFDEEYIDTRQDRQAGKSQGCGDRIVSGDPYAEYCAVNNIEFVARTNRF